VAAVLLGLAAATAVGASAASLGGLDSDDLGADSGIVASCDTNGMDVRYVDRFHTPSNGYRVQQVVFRFVSAECDGMPYDLTLIGADGTTYEASGDSLDVRNIRDRQAGPGVDLAGVVRLRVLAPAENISGVAFVIGGSSLTELI
jgi:hypothetical protein